MDKEINIAISTTHDARGVEEAEKSLKEIKEAGKDSMPEPPREAQEALKLL